jgi:hypothetical protein
MARTVSSNNNITAKTVARRVLESKREAKKTQKPVILNAYQERKSLRGLSRIFDIHRQGISRWIVEHVKSLSKFKDTLLPAQPEDILEDVLRETLERAYPRSSQGFPMHVSTGPLRSVPGYAFRSLNKQSISKNVPDCNLSVAVANTGRWGVCGIFKHFLVVELVETLALSFFCSQAESTPTHR